MFLDFKELLKSFNAHGVKYLVVGGYAVSFHAQPRATKDLNLFVKADLENAKAVYAALGSFGAPLEGLSLEDLADGTKFIRFGREPLAVDVLPGIDGVNFDDAWLRRISGVIDVATGLTAFLLPRKTSSRQKLRLAVCAIWPMSKKSVKQERVNPIPPKLPNLKISKT